jgi:trimeric autotransporter adhesin
MASTYVNDLRLNEMATGDGSGTWGTTTNTNLELIAEAFSYGTEVITTNADTHTTTIADGATDPGRSMYLKYTGTLDSACTITIGPNTVSKLWFIENATSGSQNIILSCGSGANITILPGDTKVVYSDGAGAGAAFVDAFASLSVVDLIVGGDIDLEGSIDVNGTANLDVVDIDGAVNMATTALVTGVLTTTATQVATGGITSGSDIISDTDSTDSLGSTGVRWLKGWFDTLTAGTLTVGSGSVTDSSGAISFGDENLTTTGIVTAAGTSVFTNLDISGDVDVDGTLETDNLTVGGAQGTDGQVLTSTGSGVAWEDASGGATDINGLSDAKTFGTSSLMLGDATTGTIDAADYNTGLGVDVFAALTSGDYNVAVGFAALDANTTGYINVAVGSNALGSNVVGLACTAVGDNALAACTNSYNTAVGRNALAANTSAASNSAFGTNCLATNTTGANVSAFGYEALYANTTGDNNTAVGNSALTANTTGTGNTASGYQAMVTNVDGSNNAAFGREALADNTSGAENTAVGYTALGDNTTASYNTAVGRQAGRLNTTGAHNTFVGYTAGRGNTTAAYNVALGSGALYANTTGTGMTCLGYNSGNYTVANTTGSQTTMLGAYSHGTTVAITNANIIGYNVAGEADYTTIGISTSDIRAANGTATWAAVSDERYKKDITDSTAGLSFINALQPRTFKYKTLGELPETFNAYEADSTEVYKNSDTNHGFIAQEVKAAIDADDSIKDGFKLWDDREDGSQEVAEAALIPVLVKAIQELSAQNAELTTRITALEG